MGSGVDKGGVHNFLALPWGDRYLLEDFKGGVKNYFGHLKFSPAPPSAIHYERSLTESVSFNVKSHKTQFHTEHSFIFFM